MIRSNAVEINNLRFSIFAKSASNVFYRHHGLDAKNISTEACRALSLSLNLIERG